MRSRPERRRLQFERVDDVLAEVDRLATADAPGPLATSSGRWTLGQSLNHLAT